MAKILILIGAHLCTAPRPQKEALALAQAGHEVIVAGFWFDQTHIQRDRILLNSAPYTFHPIIDFSFSGMRQRANRLQMSLTLKVAQLRFRFQKHFSPCLLGFGPEAALRFALKTHADLTIVHSEAGLWVGVQLLDAGYRVGIDFEDWFSRDLPLVARSRKPIEIMKKFEARLLHECHYRLATSNAMAKALADTYKVLPPLAIYNAFSKSDRHDIKGSTVDRINRSIPSLVWFSQTIGAGRGLETLWAALHLLRHPCEVHLRGSISSEYTKLIEQQIPDHFKERIFMHPTVPNRELPARLAEHDIGLALETKSIPSRDVTITNKLFQYLQAGLAVLATDTSGQAEILEKVPQIGQLVKDGNSEHLADVLNQLLEDSNYLAQCKAASLAAFEQHYCWEVQEKELLKHLQYSLDEKLHSIA